MTPTNDILQKIKKLLALAGNNNNPAEAALAAARAQELMNQYQLSQGEVDATILANTDPMGDHEFADKTTSSWKTVLVNNIALINNCRCLASHRRTRLQLFGRQSDRQVVEYLSCYLIREIERLAEIAIRTHQFQSRRVWMNNFGMGASAVIIGRMKAERGIFEAENTALIVRRDLVTEDYFRKLYPKTQEAKTSCRGDASAAAAGRDAGKRIQWSSGIGQGRVKAIA